MISVAFGILLAGAIIVAAGLVLAILDTGPGIDVTGTDIALVVIAVLMILIATVTS
jgi:hypothetical protein